MLNTGAGVDGPQWQDTRKGENTVGKHVKVKELAQVFGAVPHRVTVEKVERAKFARVEFDTPEAAAEGAAALVGQETVVSGAVVRVRVEARGKNLGSKNKPKTVTAPAADPMDVAPATMPVVHSVLEQVAA